MKGQLVFLTDENVWSVHNEDENLYIPLWYQHDEYVKSLSPYYIKNAVIGRDFEYEIIDEFSHPELFKVVSWGEGIICAKLTDTNPSESWHQIFMKYTNMSDEEFIEMLEHRYHAPRTKMPF